MSRKSTKKVRVAIIGSGFGVYGLAPAFKKVKDCEIVAMCGTHERIFPYAKSIGLSKIYASWKEMLDNERIDALVIATPPFLQYEIARIAIKKGIHIFGEKPLADSYTHARELTHLAKKHKVVTAVDFIFPEIPLWQKTKKRIESGRYGEVLHIDVSWKFLSYDLRNGVKSWKTVLKSGGGALSFFASHTLYYLTWFGGGIKKIDGNIFYDKRSLGGGDVGVQGSVQFKKRLTGTLEVKCNVEEVQEHKLTFTCERGVLTLASKEGVTDHFILTIQTKKGVRVLEQKIKKKVGDERVDTVLPLAKRFIESIKKKKQMTPSFKEGLEVQKLIKEVRRGDRMKNR